LAGLQPVAIASAANPLTRSSLVIGRFLEWLEVQWVCAASLSPRLPS
jgi:hypothetical protein